MIYDKVTAVMTDRLGVPAQEITPETSLVEDLAADSLDLFELAMAIEEAFNIEIPSEDLEKVTTVGSVMTYLKEKGAVA